jgi:GMP synthase (glutamine-hydrolysing)
MPVWMSHGDSVTKLPKGMRRVASSPDCPLAVAEAPERGLYGLQFHPEVAHTPHGKGILRNFLVDICGCRRDWRITRVVQETVARLREQVGPDDQGDEVVCGLSGGVDSAVVAALLHRAIGRRLHCVFVDNGLLRLAERDLVEATFRRHFRMDLRVVDAERGFLAALKGVTDPERKRKVIGRLFIRIFEREAKRFRRARFLAQGTLYPDVIESVAAFGGPTAVIKSHHNVGGLPRRMGFTLVEPLRELFKDEVRQMGLTLGLPPALVWRHPFPGPGLAVRCLGPVTKSRLDTLRRADAIVTEEISRARLDSRVWQAFGVLLPVRSVGVMGDERTYEEALCIRAVTSVDGMTADWARLPHDLLARISSRIVNGVRGVNRVVYDISTKPPSTIEWE